MHAHPLFSSPVPALPPVLFSHATKTTSQTLGIVVACLPLFSIWSFVSGVIETPTSSPLPPLRFDGAKIGHSPFYESIDYPADEALASAVEEGIASVEQVSNSARLAPKSGGVVAGVLRTIFPPPLARLLRFAQSKVDRVHTCPTVLMMCYP